MAKQIPLKTLSGGGDIPLLGFGTFKKGRTSGVTYQAVLAALNAGYRHVDGAWFYNNEDEVGDAIRDWLASNPAISRSELFITTKVWPHLCGSDADIEWSLEDSLRKLGLDYVDCFLIHWPVAAKRTADYQPRIGTDGKYCIVQDRTEHPEKMWPIMEKLFRQGKTRSIGVSNWSIAQLESLLASAEIIPMINQVEIHPYCPNTELVEYCLSRKILPMAYSPLGSQHSIPGTDERLRDNPELQALAAAKGANVAQVLIAWGLKRGYGVLPASTNSERIKANLSLIDLSEADLETISRATNRRHRFCDLEYIFGYDVWKESS